MRFHARLIGAQLAMMVCVVSFAMALLLMRSEPTMVADDNMLSANDLFRAGRYAEARAAFDAARNDGADAMLAQSGAAECSWHMGEFDDVLARCRELRTDVHWRGVAHRLRGLTFLKQGLGEKARHEFEMGTRYGDRYCPSLLKETGG